MPRRTMRVAFATLVIGCLLAPGEALGARQNQPLQQYVVRGDITADELARAGYDLHEAQDAKRGFNIVATQAQAAELAAKGATVSRLSKGRVRAVARAARRLPADGPDARLRRLPALEPERPRRARTTCATPLKPLKDWYYEDYRRQPRHRAQASSTASRCSARIWSPTGSRAKAQYRGKRKPVVLYNSTQHAREWIATETNRRLFKYFLEHKNDARTGHPAAPARRPRCGSCRSSTPTATTTRSSPRTRASGARTCATTTATARSPSATASTPTATGRTKWRFDPEGASDNPASETYRGTGAGVRARGALPTATLMREAAAEVP